MKWSTETRDIVNYNIFYNTFKDDTRKQNTTYHVGGCCWGPSLHWAGAASPGCSEGWLLRTIASLFLFIHIFPDPSTRASDQWLVGMGQRRLGPLPKYGINSELQFSFIFFSKFLYTFCPNPTTCGILVPWPGIESMLPALEAWSLNNWTTREV